jgi:hypothetical protein
MFSMERFETYARKNCTDPIHERGYENLLEGAKASQSSTENSAEASLAIDGNLQSNYWLNHKLSSQEGPFCSTTKMGSNPWFKIQLADLSEIHRIVIDLQPTGKTVASTVAYQHQCYQ